ncbi:proline racemase family [Exophiala viscosa]|uniref:Proline racemase family n=1 Tax=Exophiala viscosa TaxID=2486360 RepID=A0AAN6DMG9_9EURO|nr:proline racemase family [Exophiala viscosa]KAI1620123.1 proline racemase family [Exophiala viscosa]
MTGAMIWNEFPQLGQLLGERPGLDVVDSHTCGQPTRVILSGTGLANGMTPEEGREFLRTKADWVRRLAVMEPRGHRSMFGAAIIHPSSPGDPFGVVFMDAGSYPDMCGHATIGVATTLCELGLIGRLDTLGSNANFSFQLRTPAGTLELTAKVKGGRCSAIVFQTPLAYYVGSMELALASGQLARVDVGWGGQYYAFVPVESVGLDITPGTIDQLIIAATLVRQQLAVSFESSDPRTGTVPTIGNIVWTALPRNEAAHARNVPVSSSGSFDRSPCGTATCARMAVLEARGELAVGQDFVNESILGTLYYGRAIRSFNGDNYRGIVPQVQGSAWITAAGRLSRDTTDPLGLGYLIGGGPAVV